MKSIKNLWLLLAMVAMISFVSCDKDESAIVEPTVELGDVTFDVTNFITELASKDGILKESIECSDLTPDFVYVKINGVEYELNLVTLATSSGGMQSEVLKLAPGTYTIEEFAVYNGTTDNGDADDTVLFASPELSSEYVTKWGMTGVTKSFTVEAFKKAPVAVDVLCYVPSDYTEFGFTWMQFDKFQSKKIYFFGDICTKYWEEWAAYQDGPYVGAINGYDFPAGFTVDVYLGTDTSGAPNVSGTYVPADYVGVAAEPLCIEYIDNLQSIDETYTYVITLNLPDGGTEVVHTGTFTDSNWSKVTPDADTFGGDDGIFDFVIGNCSYDGNNGNYELPAWVPVPTGPITFKVAQGGADGYVQATFDLGGPAVKYGDLQHGVSIPMWCAEKDADIYIGRTYNAMVYSSLDLAGTLPSTLSSIPWGKLNWIMNHKDGFSTTQIQNALWWLIHNGGSGAAVAGLTDVAVAGWEPTVGDWAILIVDADGMNANQDEVQLMIVRVDP